jgi:hypothetical protein
MHTNITGVHEVFKVISDMELNEPNFMIDEESTLHNSPRKTIVDHEIFF